MSTLKTDSKGNSGKGRGKPNNREQLLKDKGNKQLQDTWAKEIARKSPVVDKKSPKTDKMSNKNDTETESDLKTMLNAIKSEILDAIRNEVSNSIKGIESKVEELISKCEDKIENLQGSIENKIQDVYKSVEMKIDDWDSEKMKLLERIQKLEEADRRKDQEYRRKNIIIRGLKTEKKNLKEEIERFISSKLETEVELKTVVKVKPMKGEEFIKARVKNVQDKWNILEKNLYSEARKFM